MQVTRPTSIGGWNIISKDKILPYSTYYKEAMKFLAKLFPKENCSHGLLAVARSGLFAILPKKLL